MQVSLSALKVFEAAALLGSFKAAAAELSISPTAVSHHISNLEQRLNVALFDRTARKVRLTRIGEELAAATSLGFHTIETALESIWVKDKQIQVATTSSFAALVLIPALHQFYAQYPDSTVNIISGENLDADQFTLSIRLGDINKQSSTDVIKHEQFNLFCGGNTAAEFNLSTKITVYTTKWKNNALPEVPLLAWLELNGLPNKNIEVKYFDQELFGIQQCLVENAFVFCSKTLAQGYLKGGVLSELSTQAVNSQLCYYIANKEMSYSRHNFMFIAWLEKLLSAC